MNIYFAEPSLSKLSASHMYAWKMGLKTGQYYLRSRPARDAIQFTLDLDAVETNIAKNKTQAEMDAERKKKKRTHAEMTAPNAMADSIDLNKKRKLTEAGPAQSEKMVPIEDKSTEPTKPSEEKPWENKPEEEEDYRWAVCENCQ